MNNLITFFIVLYGIVCILLILLVIIQGGKAEGLFASAQANVLGSRGTDVLTKLTRIFAAIFIIGALLISVFISSRKSAFEKTLDNTKAPIETQSQTTIPAATPTNNLGSTNQ